jgi:hypothetical protein
MNCGVNVQSDLSGRVAKQGGRMIPAYRRLFNGVCPILSLKFGPDEAHNPTHIPRLWDFHFRSDKETIGSSGFCNLEPNQQLKDFK